MIARVDTLAFIGLRAVDVEVQVQTSRGLPSFTLVGLADKAVVESRERVRAALSALGLSLPPQRLIVNLAPASLAKEGSHFDLPIALALLTSFGVIAQNQVAGTLALGELGLDGTLAPVNGVLPAAVAALERGRELICPASQAQEAAWVKNLSIAAADNLLALIAHLKGEQPLPSIRPRPLPSGEILSDLKDLKGQESARRCLEIAAAGGHNLLMIGPPGAGKSMLAQRMPAILPPMTAQEALEVSMIHSLANLLKDHGLMHRRPFRAPHHSASLAALTGGGSGAKPGEITLAHLGVLFLDELPEFSRQALESMRQPMENGEITVARAANHVTYPAQAQIVAAMNPCRCGLLGDPEQTCRRAPLCAEDYQSRISGPLYDRIDLTVEMPAIRPSDFLKPGTSESSAQVAKRVLDARQRQTLRYQKYAQNSSNPIRTNAQANNAFLDDAAKPGSDAHNLLIHTAEKLRLTGRGYYRVLRVARTIADLAAETHVTRAHIAEAITYRRQPPWRAAPFADKS